MYSLYEPRSIQISMKYKINICKAKKLIFYPTSPTILLDLPLRYILFDKGDDA